MSTITAEDLLKRRASLAQQREQHLRLAEQASGALQLVDALLETLKTEAPQPNAAGTNKTA